MVSIQIRTASLASENEQFIPGFPLKRLQKFSICFVATTISKGAKLASIIQCRQDIIRFFRNRSGGTLKNRNPTFLAYDQCGKGIAN